MLWVIDVEVAVDHREEKVDRPGEDVYLTPSEEVVEDFPDRYEVY